MQLPDDGSIEGSGAGDRVTTAQRSLEDTEDRLLSRYSVGRRFLARYALGSLLPSRKKRR